MRWCRGIRGGRVGCEGVRGCMGATGVAKRKAVINLGEHSRADHHSQSLYRRYFSHSQFFWKDNVSEVV